MLSCQNCPRGLTNCQPLSNIVSDDKKTFVCCGLSDPDSRSRKADKFRNCFKSEDTDSMYDYDERDMKHQIAVMADGLAVEEMIENEKEKAPWNTTHSLGSFAKNVGS